MAKKELPGESELDAFLFPTVAADRTLSSFSCNLPARKLFDALPRLRRRLKRVRQEPDQEILSVSDGDKLFFAVRSHWEKEGATGPLFFLLEDPLSLLSQTERPVPAPAAVVAHPGSDRTESGILGGAGHLRRLQEDRQAIGAFFAARKAKGRSVQNVRLAPFFQKLTPLFETLRIRQETLCPPEIAARASPAALLQIMLYLVSFFHLFRNSAVSIRAGVQNGGVGIVLSAADPEGVCRRITRLFHSGGEDEEEGEEALFFSPLLFAAHVAGRERIDFSLRLEQVGPVVSLLLPRAEKRDASFFSVPEEGLESFLLRLIHPGDPVERTPIEKDKKQT